MKLMDRLLMNSTDDDVKSCTDYSTLSDDSVTSTLWMTDESRHTALASAVLSLCFIIVGLPSNLLIVTGIFRYRLYSQPTYIFLLNLAMCDFFMCALVMPFTVVSGFTGEFVFGSNDRMRCRICQFGLTLVLFAVFSLYALAALSVDRWIFIRYSLKYHIIITPKRAIAIVSFLWLLNFLLSTPPLFEFGEIVFQKMVATCFMRFISETRLAPNYYYVILVAVTAIVPLIIIFVTNIWILCIVQKHIRRIYTIRHALHDKKVFMRMMKEKLKTTKHRKQLQLMKVFGVIIITNFLTWIPVILRCLLAFVSSTFSDWWHFAIFSSLISFAVLHPIIQTFLIPEMKAYFFSLLKKAVFWQNHGKLSGRHGCYSPSHEGGNQHSSVNSGGCKCSCCNILDVMLVPVSGELHSNDTV